MNRPGLIPQDVTVIDPVIHAFNLDRSNVCSKYGEQLYEMSHGLHAIHNPPDLVVDPDLYLTDMPIEALVRTVFLESQTDIAATHTLTLNSWFSDGFCSRKKTEEGVKRWPNRVLGYLGLDPTQDVSQVLDELEAQHEVLPEAVGVKLYPHQMDPYKRWRAGDDTVMRMIERAQALGIKTIAIHKALPNGSVPLDPYKVDDLEPAADAFPDMAFEIVHGGMAFVEETAFAIARYPNVYCNLETTTGLLFRAPGRFAETLAQLLFWGGPEKILWSTGCTVAHPQILLERFWSMQFSQDTMDRIGVPQIDDVTKRLILAGNYARMAGLDMNTRLAAIAGDEFSQTIGERGLATPWSSWRAMAEVTA